MGVTAQDANVRTPAVFLVVDDFPPAICGIGDYSAHLATALAGRGCRVTVLTKAAPAVTTEGFGEGVIVRPVIDNWGYGDVPAIIKELRAMPEQTVVQIEYSSASNYNRGSMINVLPALLRVVESRMPVVVTMHGFHERRSRFRLRATPMLLAANSCIFVHNKDHELVTRSLPMQDRAECIPIASNIPSIPFSEDDRSLVRRSVGVSDADRIVLFFGDFREEKGVLDLIAAASAARKLVPGLRLVLVGGLRPQDVAGFKRYAERLDDAIKAGESDGFLVRVANPEPLRVARLLRAADLTVFPFLDGACENRGSMLAAIANEAATLTTEGTSTAPGFARDYGVDLVPAADVETLAARMTELLLDPGKLECLRKQSALAAKKCSWGAIADRHIEIYRRLASRQFCRT